MKPLKRKQIKSFKLGELIHLIAVNEVLISLTNDPVRKKSLCKETNRMVRELNEREQKYSALIGM